MIFDNFKGLEVKNRNQYTEHVSKKFRKKPWKRILSHKRQCEWQHLFRFKSNFSNLTGQHYAYYMHYIIPWCYQFFFWLKYIILWKCSVNHVPVIDVITIYYLRLKVEGSRTVCVVECFFVTGIFVSKFCFDGNCEQRKCFQGMLINVMTRNTGDKIQFWSGSTLNSLGDATFVNKFPLFQHRGGSHFKIITYRSRKISTNPRNNYHISEPSS